MISQSATFKQKLVCFIRSIDCHVFSIRLDTQSSDEIKIQCLSAALSALQYIYIARTYLIDSETRSPHTDQIHSNLPHKTGTPSLQVTCQSNEQNSQSSHHNTKVKLAMNCDNNRQITYNNTDLDGHARITAVNQAQYKEAKTSITVRYTYSRFIEVIELKCE